MIGKRLPLILTVLVLCAATSGVAAQGGSAFPLADRVAELGASTGQALVDGAGDVAARLGQRVDAVNTSTRRVVARVGEARVATLKARAAALMTRMSLVRMKVGRLSTKLNAAADDAAVHAALASVAGVEATCLDVETTGDELVAEAADSVADAKVRAADARAQAEARAAQAALEAADRLAEAQAALKYVDVSSEDFWMTQFETETEQVAVIDTNKGTMLVAFHTDVAPGHVKNFVDLSKKGFYDGLLFHRVIPDFMVQGGCPKGDGTGGPGYQVKAEFSDKPHLRGTLSMARSGHPDSAGSQFFICHDDVPHLDNKYTVFGQLLKGFDVLDAIAGSDLRPGDRPVQDVVMTKVVIRDRTPEDISEVN